MHRAWIPNRNGQTNHINYGSFDKYRPNKPCVPTSINAQSYNQQYPAHFSFQTNQRRQQPQIPVNQIVSDSYYPDYSSSSATNYPVQTNSKNSSNTSSPRHKDNSMATNKEKDNSLFSRWKAQNTHHDSILANISAEELEEFREAFKLFDKVS